MIRNSGMDILIVDDEPLARNRLKALCSRLDNISRVRLASSGLEALEIVEADTPDLILLDVDMPDVSGIEVAEKLQMLGKKPGIIFTTAHSKYAVKAFRLQAVDFLLKPVRQELLYEAVERVTERLAQAIPSDFGEAENETYLWIKDGDGSVQVRCSDIGHIVAEQDYMRLHVADRSFLIHETMQSLVKFLPKDRFIRIHRSTMVRRDFIREIRRSQRRKYVVLKNGTDLTIGGSYANAIIGQAGGFGLLETVSE
ncbi:MAG: LytTR family DNA-binding domain-containing protein [Parasphingorhabdus sp.]